MLELDSEFWAGRYREGTTGWDIGYPSPPITTYFESLASQHAQAKDAALLIPGCGNAYEAEYLHSQGFKNVHLLDWAAEPLEAFSKRVPDFPKSHLHQGDFFTHSGSYDFVVEQTFFCAINPSLRPDYVLQVHKLLVPEGKLVGLFWDDPMFDNRPPFGGSRQEYRELFQAKFEILSLDPALDSIGPRAGREVFMEARRLT